MLEYTSHDGIKSKLVKMQKKMTISQYQVVHNIGGCTYLGVRVHTSWCVMKVINYPKRQREMLWFSQCFIARLQLVKCQ